MIEKLRQLNINLIKKYSNSKTKLKRQILIRQLLTDPNCFFKINIECAYGILRDLELPETELDKIYIDLIQK